MLAFSLSIGYYYFLFSLGIARYCSYLRAAYMVVSLSIVFKTIYYSAHTAPKAKAMAKYKNLI